MRTVFGALALALIAGSAQANWVHQEHGSAFSDDKTQLALTGAGGYGFSLRCNRSGDFSVIYITTEQISDPEIISVLNSIGPQMLIRIDDNSVIEVGVTAEISNKVLAFIGDANSDIVSQLINSQRRASVALKSLDEIYHEQEFGVRGSTAAVNAAMAGCGITVEQ